MLMINAAFADTIERAIYYNTAKPTQTKEIELTNSHNKGEIIAVLNSSYSFEISDDVIICTVDRTQEEIHKDKVQYFMVLTSSINQLRKWCELKEEYNTQIKTYLKAKNLEWIIKEL